MSQCFYIMNFVILRKGVSADADPHYQKLYGRVTDVCSNRRGQPSPSAMKEPRPGRNPSLIRFASPSGKYAFGGFRTKAPFPNFCNTCGFCSSFSVLWRRRHQWTKVPTLGKPYRRVGGYAPGWGTKPAKMSGGRRGWHHIHPSIHTLLLCSTSILSDGLATP